MSHLKLLSDENFPSQEDVSVFCKGLACNKSIKSLEITGTHEDDFPINASKLFEYLLPFFANNKILEMIELGWIQNPSQAQIMQAIDACPALKSVKIVCCLQDDHLEGLTRASEYPRLSSSRSRKRHGHCYWHWKKRIDSIAYLFKE